MCSIVSYFYQDIIFSVADEIPLTKPSLNECIKKSKCQRFRPETKTHVYVKIHIELSLLELSLRQLD